MDVDAPAHKHFEHMWGLETGTFAAPIKIDDRVGGADLRGLPLGHRKEVGKVTSKVPCKAEVAVCDCAPSHSSTRPQRGYVAEL